MLISVNEFKFYIEKGGNLWTLPDTRKHKNFTIKIEMMKCNMFIVSYLPIKQQQIDDKKKEK